MSDQNSGYYNLVYIVWFLNHRREVSGTELDCWQAEGSCCEVKCVCVSLAGQILTWEQRLVQVVIIIDISNSQQTHLSPSSHHFHIAHCFAYVTYCILQLHPITDVHINCVLLIAAYSYHWPP